MAAINLDIGGNTRRLDRDIQKTVNRVYTINLKTKGDQPLGRITGQVNEFNKSLDASNARVIAFGASAGIIFGVQRAFTALVGATIEVQKSLQDINVILNVSAQNLQKFGGELFSIAKNTGQSFQEVAKAATEFSRQGLGVEETLKRTNEALILSRLSGLDAAKSVEALTAAVNSYASQAVTASEVVNKFANVDAAFAVSSADLAEALQRVGSSAAQSGVSLNELIAIVTSAQQTTARGGAVIGNSFKTIFTRLQRGKVVDLLESLGISSTDSSGQVKSTIQLLQDLGKIYDNLGSQQQAYVAEQVGGVFQINILKAALADLGKEYSIYGSALNVAAGSTDQAIRRNEELNKTYAAQLNALQENARQLASAAGERLVGPSIDRLVGGSNTLLEGINESDGQGFGAVLGKGILDGLGQFIAGPGLALIGGVLLKLFRDLGKFATGSVQQLLGLNTAATQQKDLQTSITQILAKNPQLLELALKGELGLNTAANSLLASLQKQTVELQKQATVAQQISRAFVAQAGVRVTGGVPVVPTGRAGKAAGYIPNFAQGDFAREELLATSLGAKNPTAQLSKGTIDGKKFIKNNREVEITGFGSNGDSAVIPNYAKGFIPNFAKFDIGGKVFRTAQIPDAIKTGKISEDQARKAGYLSTKEKKALPKNSARPTKDIAQLLGFKLPTILTPSAGGGISRTRQDLFPDGTDGQFNFQAFGIKSTSGLKDDFEGFVGKNNFIDRFINDNLLPFATKIASVVKAPPVEPNTFQEIKGAKGFRSSIEGALGGIFDAAITTAIGLAGGDPEKGDFDVRTGGAQKTEYINELFGSNSLGGRGSNLGDFKKNVGRDAAKSMVDKTIKEYGTDIQAKYKSTNIQKKAAGYIPNFAAIQDAVSRERAAGIPSSQIYLAQEKALTGANPMGLGVFNKQDEPTKGSRKNAMRQKGFARGYIPNFAETPESSAASIGTVAGALVSQLGILAITLQGSGREYKESLQEISKSNVESAKKQTSAAREKVLKEKDFSKRPELRKEYLAAKSQEKTSARVSGGQKLGAGVRAGGFGLGIAAPILAQTLTQAIPQDTKTGRVSAAGVGALGNIGAATATGAAFGPVGAAVGAAAGALLEIPNVVNQFTSDLPELTKSTQKAQESLQQINDSGSKFLQSFENYNKLLSEGADPAILQKAQDEYSKALYGLSEEQQKTLTSAASVGKLQEAYAKILEEATSRKAIEEFGDALGTVAADIADFSSSLDAVGFFGTGKSQLDVSTTEGKARTENITKTLESELTFGKTNQEIIKLSGGLKSISTASAVSEDGFESYIDQLVNTGALSEKSGGQLKKMGDDISYSQGRAAASSQILNILGNTFGLIGDKADKAKTAAEELEVASKKEAEAKKLAVKATEQIIDSLERNIRMAQMAADTNRALAKANSEFQRNTAFADTFSRPSETVGAIVGQGAPLAEAFSLRESIAQIGFNQIGQIENVKSVFVNDINESIKTAFNEGVGETRGKATGEGTAADIQKGNKEILKPLAGQQEKAFAVVQDVLNKTLSGGGDINTEAVLSDISNSLKEANINNETIQKITTQVREAGAKGNLEIEKLRNASINEFKTLAKEQTQKILIAKIGQAQKFGGGIGEFINPQESGESLFGKVVQSTKGFDKFQGQQVDSRFDYKTGTNEFKYGYGAAQRARQEMAPEYGRAALDLTDQLQAFTGYTPNADGKAVQAGEAGLKEFYDRQVKELQTIAKDSSTPQIVKDEINAALKEVEKLGGTKNIAKLQVAQRTGALTESGFKEITGKFQNPVLQSLQEQAKLVGTDTPEGQLLAQQIEELQNVTITSQDPTIQAINSGNIVLQQILTAIENGGTSGVTPDFKGNISTDVNKAVQQVQKSTFTEKAGRAAAAIANPGIEKGLKVTQLPGTKDTGLEVTQLPSADPGLKRSEFPSADPGLKRIEAAAYKANPEQLKSDEIARKRRDLGLEYNRANILPELPELKPSAQGGRSSEQLKSDEIARKRRDLGLEYNRANILPELPELKPSAQGGRSSEQLNTYPQRDRSSEKLKAQPVESSEQLFTQQEAAFATNSAAIAALTGGIQSLNATLSSFQELNKTADVTSVGAGAQTSAQPNITTTTSAPVNVVVNAQGGGDIAKAVGEAVQNAIPTIIEKVRLAMGEKVPPTTLQLPNINIK